MLNIALMNEYRDQIIAFRKEPTFAAHKRNGTFHKSLLILNTPQQKVMVTVCCSTHRGFSLGLRWPSQHRRDEGTLGDDSVPARAPLRDIFGLIFSNIADPPSLDMSDSSSAWDGKENKSLLASS
jgi:hypothetical protein